MSPLAWRTSQALSRVLCVGAHCDDIEIGCGGTVLKLCEEVDGVSVDWVVLSSDERRATEARISADRFLERAAEARVRVESFRNRYFPYIGGAIKEYFDRLSDTVAPDLIFTHYRHDLHQDHRIVSELTYNTFRDHLILEYEIPKYDGDMGRPNAYVHLAASHCDAKIAAILESFPSQLDKQWFTAETFRSMLRLRGIESKSSSGYAEAFHCRKMVLA